MTAANEYAAWNTVFHILLAFSLFRQLRRSLFSSISAVERKSKSLSSFNFPRKQSRISSVSFGLLLLLDAYHLTLHALSALLLSSTAFLLLAFVQV